MPSLERFFNPQTRPFGLNITSLPGARMYFFSAGTTTPKTTYQDKQGSVAHDNPVIADSSGIFPQIFLDGLYRVELRSSANIVQPGWPIDNVGQDFAIVPFAAWSEIVTYQEFEVVSDPLTGDWYRSLVDDNVGNDPTTTTGFWEALVSPVASNFISDASWISFSSEPGKISLDVDEALLETFIENNVDQINGPLTVAGLKVGNSPVVDASTLDWYEEGVFTPQSSGTGTIGTGTYTNQVGTYTRIGNRVIFDINITWTAHTGIGNLRVGDLPFTASKETTFNAVLIGLSSPTYCFGETVIGGSAFNIFAIDGSTGSLSAVNIDPAATVRISGSYQTA